MNHSELALDTLGQTLAEVAPDWYVRDPPPYSAVAYDWYYPEWGKPHLIRVVAGVMRTGRTTDMETVKLTAADMVLGRMPQTKGKGTSEAIGLIPTSTYAYDDEGRGTIERDVSDLLMAIVMDELKDVHHNCVLIQGPLSPKLVGRLGYRHMSANINVAAYTFKQEWFPLVPPEPNILLNSKLPDKCFGTVWERRAKGVRRSAGNRLLLGDLRATNGIEEVLRTWAVVEKPVGAKSESAPASADSGAAPDSADARPAVRGLLEVFCQFPLSLPASSEGHASSEPWIQKLGAIQPWFREAGVVFEQGTPTWLPLGLACAYDRCKYQSLRVLPATERMPAAQWGYLQCYEDDARQMYENGWEAQEVVSRRSMLYLALHSGSVYGLLQESVKREDRDLTLDEAETDYARGMSLTRVLQALRNKPGWSLERWRRLIC